MSGLQSAPSDQRRRTASALLALTHITAEQASAVPMNVIFERDQFFRSADLALDQVWPLGAKRSLELSVKLFGRSRPRRRHAKARRDMHPVERRITEIEHRFHFGVEPFLANPRHLEAENGVGVIFENDDYDVGFLSRHRPQRLDGIHAAAVRLEMNNLPVGAGDRRAESQ